MKCIYDCLLTLKAYQQYVKNTKCSSCQTTHYFHWNYPSGNTSSYLKWHLLFKKKTKNNSGAKTELLLHSIVMMWIHCVSIYIVEAFICIRSRLIGLFEGCVLKRNADVTFRFYLLKTIWLWLKRKHDKH